MPKIEPLDWGKLRPNSPEVKHRVINSLDERYWRYKKKTAPTSTSKKHGAIKTTKRPKWNPKDHSIGQKWHDTDQHLRSIMHEQ